MNNEQGADLHIPGIDVNHGIAMTGGSEAGYIEVLSIYCRDSEDRLPLIKNLPEADTILTFITQVHALKSASSSIGAANVASLAAELEAAGKSGDFTLIKEKLPDFVSQLSEIVANIKNTLEKCKKSAASSSASDISLYFPYFQKLILALESNNANDIRVILKDIKDYSREHPLDEAGKEALEKISDEVMMVEYDNAIKILKELLEQ